MQDQKDHSGCKKQVDAKMTQCDAEHAEREAAMSGMGGGGPMPMPDRDGGETRGAKKKLKR